MTKWALYLILVPAVCGVQAEPESVQEKSEVTTSQMERLKAAEEQYKDNPAIMKIIGNLKEQYGVTGETQEKEEPAPAAHETAFQGSRSTAEDAYRNQDYKTAMTHYQSLAAKGDAEASLIVGTMYELGQGTERDPASAQAWFRKAAEGGDPHGMDLMNLYRIDPPPAADQSLADQRYAEISKESANGDETSAATGSPDRADGSAVKYRMIETSARQSPGSRHHLNTGGITARTAQVTLEKRKPMPHLKTTSSPAAGWQPEKIQRITTGSNPE